MSPRRFKADSSYPRSGIRTFSWRIRKRSPYEGETLGGKRTRVKLKVPTLPAFVLAKGLIFERRPTVYKKGKDLAYLYEVLMKPEWRKRIIEGLAETAAKHPAPWYRKFKRNLDEAFATENSSGPTWIALQYPGRDAAETGREAFRAFRAFLVELKVLRGRLL